MQTFGKELVMVEHKRLRVINVEVQPKDNSTLAINKMESLILVTNDVNLE